MSVKQDLTGKNYTAFVSENTTFYCGKALAKTPASADAMHRFTPLPEAPSADLHCADY